MAWTTSYFHFDAIGSTRGITGADQNFQASYPQTAFGEQLVDTTTAENPFRFVGQTGYYNDNETGLVNVRQRVYDAGLGRWLSQDRVESDRNLYRYSRNEPLQNVDPDGLFPLIITGQDPSSWNIFGRFSRWRAKNVEAREKERQERQERRERAVLQHRFNSDTRRDYYLMVPEPPDNRGVMTRMEDEFLLVTTGLSRDAAVLPMIKLAVSATGRDPSARSDEWYLKHPGRWPFDMVVGELADPLNYFLVAVPLIAPKSLARFATAEARIAEIGAMGGEEASLVRLYSYSRKPINTSLPFYSSTGRVYLTSVSPGPWLTDTGIVARIKRFVRTGWGEPFPSQNAYFTTGLIDPAEWRLSPIFPRTANFWKRLGGQYHSKIGISGFQFQRTSSGENLLLNLPVRSTPFQVLQARGGLVLEGTADVAAAGLVGTTGT